MNRGQRGTKMNMAKMITEWCIWIGEADTFEKQAKENFQEGMEGAAELERNIRLGSETSRERTRNFFKHENILTKPVNEPWVSN